MVMKKATVIVSIMIVLLSAHRAQAGVSIVMNGSFENNGQVPDITAEAPQYWCDVSVPSDKFAGKVNTDWSTYGDYSLILYSKALGKCNDGDMAMVSQQVYLAEDANQIIFDLKLSSSSGNWDPDKRSAVVLIDGNDVWDSNTLGSGEYLKVFVDVNEEYKDANLHTLTLAIRSNVTETSYPYREYRARWDFVKFDAYCGGFGYLPEDIDRDCYVDFRDFAMLAGHWLEENPAYKYDLVEDGVVNEYDLMFFAEGWLDCSYWENWQDDNCYEVELPAADLNDDGIVDFCDFTILAGDWGSNESCIRADVDGSGEVDYHDISIMADEWLLKSWLYGLE